MKLPINFDEMTSKELLHLAKKSIREINEREVHQFKIVDK